MLALAAAAVLAAAAEEPRIVVHPEAFPRAYPGRAVTTAVTGFPAGAVVRIGVGGAGSCRPRQLGEAVTDDDGGAFARVVMPRFRRACDGRWRRWRPLSHVTFWAVSGDRLATTTAQVNPRHRRRARRG